LGRLPVFIDGVIGSRIRPEGYRGRRKALPWSRLLNREACAALCQSLDVVDGLLRFGAALVIGIDIRCTNDTAAVDHEPSRHR